MTDSAPAARATPSAALKTAHGPIGRRAARPVAAAPKPEPAAQPAVATAPMTDSAPAVRATPSAALKTAHGPIGRRAARPAAAAPKPEPAAPPAAGLAPTTDPTPAARATPTRVRPMRGSDGRLLRNRTLIPGGT
jgi:hypothetical protein